MRFTFVSTPRATGNRVVPGLVLQLWTAALQLQRILPFGAVPIVARPNFAQDLLPLPSAVLAALGRIQSERLEQDGV